MEQVGKLVAGATQGYFVDEKTAGANHITSIAQLNDPKIAAMFSDDGSGKAQLYRLPAGLGLRAGDRTSARRLQASPDRQPRPGRHGRVSRRRSSPATSRASRCCITPTSRYWLSQVLVPGKDVEQLTVPFTSLPARTDPKLTTLA